MPGWVISVGFAVGIGYDGGFTADAGLGWAERVISGGFKVGIPSSQPASAKVGAERVVEFNHQRCLLGKEVSQGFTAGISEDWAGTGSRIRRARSSLGFAKELRQNGKRSCGKDRKYEKTST